MASLDRGPTSLYGARTYLFAAAVGVIGGLVGVGFQLLGHILQERIIGPGTLLDAAFALPWYLRLVIPACGALAAAALARGLTRRRASQGMGDVMEAVTLKQAQELSIRATVSRALSSLALIVTGGSIGREGPIAYMGASFGSRFARLVGVPTQRLGLYAGCGIAAGMAASYFAPFGAALFALEVVLGNFAIEIFGPVVVASVFSNLVVEGLAAGPLRGEISGAPLYDLPRYTESHAVEYLLFLLLGVIAAGGGWIFIKSMSLAERFFKRLSPSLMVTLPIGGLCVGVIGIWLPHVWGNGYHAVNLVIKQTPVLWMVALLWVMKIVATSITVGSGGSGGIFTPTMFVGAVLGMFVGTGAHWLFPDTVVDPRPYAGVGMAAAIAGTTQAPIMAIFMLFEMTRESAIVLPLVMACLAASLVSRAIGLDGVYQQKLRERGIRIPEGIEETTLTTTRVVDVMREELVWVRDSATFDMITSMFSKTRRDFVYVVGNNAALHGVVRLHDIKSHLGTDQLGAAVIAADLAVTVPRVHPAQTLAEIMQFFDDPEVHELPVVDPESGGLVGLVDRRDLITALSVEVLQSQSLRAKFVEHEGAQHYVEIPRGHALARIPVPASLAGKTFANADFRTRTGLIVLTVVHMDDGREVRIQPGPTTELKSEDALIVMGPVDAIRAHGGQL